MDTPLHHNYSVSLVAPIYNNAKTFPILLNRALDVLKKNAHEYEVFLIDDASADESPKLLKERAENNTHVRVLFHTKNKGIAATYKELYEKAKYTSVVLFSFDGEWNPDDVGTLLTMSDGYDLVIGKRTHKSYQLGRALMSFLFNNGTKLLFGIDPIDAGSIKLLRKYVIESIPINSTSVYDEAERIIKAFRHGYKIGSVPVDHYPSKNNKSVLQKIPLMLLAISDMLKLFVTLSFASPLPTASTASTTASSRKSARES